MSRHLVIVFDNLCLQPFTIWLVSHARKHGSEFLDKGSQVLLVAVVKLKNIKLVDGCLWYQIFVAYDCLDDIVAKLVIDQAIEIMVIEDFAHQLVPHFIIGHANTLKDC